MSISKGGQSVKPYVGSKEVTEAYVGSQLVYKSGLPYYYYFLGAESDYFINDNVQLGNNTAITKPAGKTTYKIACSYVAGTGAGNFNLNNINQFVGWTLKFTYSGEKVSNLVMYISYRNASGGNITSEQFTVRDTSETLYSQIVPAGCDRIVISTGGQIGTRYFDAIRFEEP